MAHPLAFSGLAHPGTNAFAAKLPQTWSLVCDAERNNKKKRPEGSRRFHKLCWKFSDYFPFLAVFLSTFFIFFAIMISFYRLLL
jgi:hypothetical protein